MMFNSIPTWSFLLANSMKLQKHFHFLIVLNTLRVSYFVSLKVFFCFLFFGFQIFLFIHLKVNFLIFKVLLCFLQFSGKIAFNLWGSSILMVFPPQFLIFNHLMKNLPSFNHQNFLSIYLSLSFKDLKNFTVHLQSWILLLIKKFFSFWLFF